MHTVKKINSIKDFKVSLTFDDNTIKVVDVWPYLDKGIFLKLKDPDYFGMVKVVGSTITWPNGADFCPDVLYSIGKRIRTNK